MLNSENLTIPDVTKGTKVIRARNRNSANRLSPYTTKTLDVDSLILGEAKSVVLIEDVKRGRNDAYVEYIVEITPSDDVRITHYILEYRLQGPTDLPGSTPEWVQTAILSASDVSEDGKIRHNISNINYDIETRSDTIFVRVTPTNNKYRGVTTYAESVIIGKTTPPKNVLNVRGGQKVDSVVIAWNYVVDEQTKKVVDQDIRRVIVRRLPGVIDVTLRSFNRATDFAIAAFPDDFITRPVYSYGTYTYFIMTEDTSGNLSTEPVGITITTTVAEGDRVLRSYNEDNPVLGDTNYGEGNWPSFNLSNTGGVPRQVGSSYVDNANGSASGWSVGTDTTDLILSSNAGVYTTQIRDIGRIIACDVSLELDPEQSLSETFSDQYNVVETGVSDVSSPSGDGAGINAATFGAWGSAVTPTRSVINANEQTTDGIYPFAPGSTNVNLYAHEGTLAVYSEGNIQYQLLAAGAVTGTGAINVRSRSLPSGTWGGWQTPDSTYYATDVNEVFDNPKFVNSTTATNIPTITGNQSDAIAILWNQSDTLQRYYIGHYGNRYWERTVTPDTPVIPVESANTLSDINIVGTTGIGDYLSNQANLRFSTRNNTLVSGPEGDRVWAIRNPGQFTNDNANAGSLALISNVVDSNTVAFGSTYYSNGSPTGTNLLANSSGSIQYQLVDLKQYSDLSPLATYEGDPTATRFTTEFRYATSAPYFSNGQVDVKAFTDYKTNDGYRIWTPSVREMRYVQFRFTAENFQPQDYDVRLDRFRYFIVRERIVRSFDVNYDFNGPGGSNLVLDYSIVEFTRRPQYSVNITAVPDLQVAAEIANVNPVVTGVTANALGLSFTLNGAVYQGRVGAVVEVSGI